MFTFKQLKYFVAVAEYGSVTAAAEALHVSQPGLSAAVTQLENLFQVQLLIRQKARGVHLTPAGRSLLASARELLGHADDVMTLGSGLNSSPEGALHLGVFHTIGPHVVPNLLFKFNQEYPGVQVSLLEGDLAELHTALMDGDIELAVAYDLSMDEHFEYYSLRRLPPYLLVAANSKFAQLASVSLRDLAEEPMILLDLPHSREYFSLLFRSVGINPNIRYRTRSVAMVRSLVANGLGYSILNFQPVEQTSYDGRKLNYVDIEEGFSGLTVVIAWRAGIRLTARARAFIETAQEHVGRQ